MITRYAIFQGTVAEDNWAAFQEVVIKHLLPTWQVYPGACDVRIAFSTEKDEAAPAAPLILAVDFATRADLDRALNSQERLDSRAATQAFLPGLFDGQILHYITTSSSHSPIDA
jgi:hypothetical protein